MEVLEGAHDALSRVEVLELELSLAPLYEGQVLCDGMNGYLVARGFELVGLDEAFVDPRTGRLLQYDAIYERAV